MSIDFDWFGVHPTPARGIRYCVRGATNGTLTVALSDGQSQTANIATETDDGVGVVSFSGLTPGATYTLTATLDGDSQSRAITLPSESEVKLASVSCIHPHAAFTSADDIIAHGAKILVMLGDVPYTDFAKSGNGESGGCVNSGTAPETIETYQCHYRHMMRSTGFRKLVAAGMQMGIMWDDHELPGDNWDHSVARAESGQAAVTTFYGGSPTQSQVDAIYWAARQAADIYAIGNPPSPDEASEKPGEAAAGTSASNYSPRYFSFKVGALYEAFVLDCITHRDSISDADGAGKTMLGDVQEAWLLASAEASTAVHKTIFSSKKTYANAVDNADTWGAYGGGNGYATERGVILADIEAASGYAVPGGFSWVAGDRHCMSVIKTSSPDHVCLCACPEGQDANDGQGSGLATGVALVDAPPTATGFGKGLNNYGLITVTPAKTRLEAWRVGMNRRWVGDVLAGSNALTYPRHRLAG